MARGFIGVGAIFALALINNVATAADMAVPIADQVPVYKPPTFSIDGQLSALWTDNALGAHTNPVSSVFGSPYLKATLTGNTFDNITYRIYARSTF